MKLESAVPKLCKFPKKSLIFMFLLFVGCTRQAPDPVVTETEVTVGYTDQWSYRAGSTGKFYFAPTIQQEVPIFYLQDLNNAKIPLKGTLGSGASATSGNAQVQTKALYNFTVPAGIKPGLYFLKDSPVVVNTQEKKKITVLLDTNTKNAYNCSDGTSLYALCPNVVKSSAVTFLRPWSLGLDSTELINNGLYIKWMKQHYPEVNFITDIDMENYENIGNSDLLLIFGHSEYWTRRARKNFDQFVEKGKNVAIFSGNTMWWQVRYEKEGSLMVCYKDFDKDPYQDPVYKTTLWTDPRLKYPTFDSIKSDFSLGGYAKIGTSWFGIKVTDHENPIYQGISVEKGEVIPFIDPATTTGTIEYDGTVLKFDNNNQPYIDNTDSRMQNYKVKLFGYDKGERGGPTYGTFFAFQKTPTSGVVVNMATTAWAFAMTKGPAKDKISTITHNIIRLLQEDPQSIFK